MEKPTTSLERMLDVAGSLHPGGVSCDGMGLHPRRIRSSDLTTIPNILLRDIGDRLETWTDSRWLWFVLFFNDAQLHTAQEARTHALGTKLKKNILFGIDFIDKISSVSSRHVFK